MQYVIIDEKTNIIDSFQKAKDFLINQKDGIDLKWFIISFHHGVHCLMLYALVDSAEGGIWVENPKNGLPILRVDELVDLSNKKNKLLPFLKAFEFIQEAGRMKHFVNSKPLIALPVHKDSMKYLNDILRNGFMHYKPGSWAVSYECIYKICKPILEVISFLISSSGQCSFSVDEKKMLKDIIEEMNNFFIKAGIK